MRSLAHLKARLAGRRDRLMAARRPVIGAPMNVAQAAPRPKGNFGKIR